MTTENNPDSDSGYCSLPSEEIYQNVRRSVISAYKQISTIISIRNALRSKLDHSDIALPIRDALRLEFTTINFHQLIKVLEAKTHEFNLHPHLHQKISGGIL